MQQTKHIGSTLDSFLQEEGIEKTVHTNALDKVAELNKEELKNKLLDTFGDFTWSFGMTFFVETSLGNFVWSDPDYNGDNTFTPFSGSYKNWIKQIGVPFGRSKGKHLIREYCGDKILIK